MAVDLLVAANLDMIATTKDLTWTVTTLPDMTVMREIVMTVMTDTTVMIAMTVMIVMTVVLHHQDMILTLLVQDHLIKTINCSTVLLHLI